MSGTKRIAIAMAVMGGLSCVAGDAVAYTVYVSNEKGNSITVIDSGTLEVKETLATCPPARTRSSSTSTPRATRSTSPMRTTILSR
jgi:hypothetical protein